jgi:hypothetical protein
MPDLDLVFDFDGWKLGGVYIFSAPTAFAFLGAAETTTEFEIQPRFFERIKAALMGKPVTVKRFIRPWYKRLGLQFEHKNSCIREFIIYVQGDESINLKGFPGHFVFAHEPIVLNATSTLQNVKDIFGNPDDEEDSVSYLYYEIKDYELYFWFDEDHKLTHLEGRICPPVVKKYQIASKPKRS